MERVGTLINKLKEQFDQQSEPSKLLLTAQMLLTELQQKQTFNTTGKVSVTLPAIVQPTAVIAAAEPIVQEVLVEEVPVSEKEQAAPAVIEHKQEEAPAAPVKEIIAAVEETNLPAEPVVAFTGEPAPIPEPVKQEERGNTWMFDTTAVTIPTLAHHGVKEVFELNEAIAVDDEAESHNEKLKQERVEVAAVLQGSPIKDLKKAIGINDRYLFINELFRGDEAMYERSIKTINSFSIYPEAEYWIQREMKTKLGWIEDTEAVKLFDQLVKRRFS